MISKIISFFTTKQALFIFILFVLFFPLKTQFYNAFTYVFDQLFTDGIMTKIYTYNYFGELLGCNELMTLRAYEETANIFQKRGMYWLRMVISGLFWLVLYLKTRKTNAFKTHYWIYVVIFAFYLASELEYFLTMITYINTEIVLSFVPFVIFFGLGIHIFFKIFGKKERLQLVFIAFPASVLSLFLWYAYLGPKLLPIITS
ncbi:hypothetical protein [Kordia sp. SMS9]|uniref:hypothetical protein n=1 Tax=Kordia sp. SMS9 TaxID=2282170 RepID=UPI0013B3F391|nr:hypothetical protein [Kordia sp. SMS9]